MIKALRICWSFIRRWVAPKPPAPAPKKRRPRRIKSDDEWSMKTLLERLDSEHKRFSFEYCKNSCSSKRDWKALRKMGPLVVPEDAALFKMADGAHDLFKMGEGSHGFQYDELIGARLPIIAFLGFHSDDKLILRDRGKRKKDDYVHHTGFYLIKQSQEVRAGLENTPGQRYEFGAIGGFEDQIELLVSTLMTVDAKTGTIYLPKLLHREAVTLPSGETYSRKICGVPNAHAFGDPSLPDWERRMRLCSAGLAFGVLRLEQIRQNFYHVSTKKDKGRVTFLVPPGRQVPFFRDRDLTILARDGKRKRIVHYTREHERVTQSGKVTTVKEHLRGIRRFTWNGYQVAISVPKFHLLASDFQLSPVAEEVASQDPKAYMSIKKVAALLSTTQDEATYSHGERAA